MCVKNFIEGDTTEYNVDDQIDDSLRSIQKLRDEIICYMSFLLLQNKMMPISYNFLLVENLM